MKKMHKTLLAVLFLVATGQVLAQVQETIPATSSTQRLSNLPPPCRADLRPVPLLNCLQEQHTIMQAVLNYHELRTRVAKSQSERVEAERNIQYSPDPEPDNSISRVQWFDENLQIYAIVGQSDQLTAYARLDGHEYRLQQNDVIRLAEVKKIDLRGVELSVFGNLIYIGLSGSNRIDE